MAKGKFWHDGLKFSCHGCGHCCTFPGGYVYGSEKEFRRIARHLNIDFDTFLEEYTESIDGHISLISPDGGPCVFYENGCSIYPVRPSQCSSYPFWQDILRSKRHWMLESETCKGIDHGKHWGNKEIESQVKNRTDKLMEGKTVRE